MRAAAQELASAASQVLVRTESPFVPLARYVGPDRSQRGFYQELRPGYPASPQPGTWFSNGSTYLRLRHSPLC